MPRRAPHRGAGCRAARSQPDTRGPRQRTQRRRAGCAEHHHGDRTLDTAAVRCHAESMRATVVLGVQGRLVVPADARRELGLAAGDELVLHTEGGRLVLERREDAGKRLRGLYVATETEGAVDELLADRRQAATAE